MAIKTVESIRITQGGSQSSPPGKFMGSDIIGMTMRVLGVGKGGTQVSVTLANESGNFTDPPLSYLTPYKIEVLEKSSGPATLTFFMYLIKREKSRSASESTMIVTFTDGSHILDRTYVGLLNQHVAANDSNFGGKIQTVANVGHTIPLLCEPCDTTADPTLPLREVTVPPSNPLTQRNLSRTGLDCYFGNNIEGGFLFVGQEEWSQTDCELHNVSYKFNDLISVANQLGISIDIQNRAPNYKANYTGTLREVLEKWCADFGFTYIWDYTFQPGQVIGVDLANNSINSTLAEIESGVRTYTSTAKDAAVLETINSTQTIEGTFRQFVVASYKQAAAPASSTRNFFYKMRWATTRLSDMLGPKEMDGRGAHDFLISCALSKVNEQARTLFNVRRGYYKPLGLTSQYEIIRNDEKENILNYCVSGDTYKDFLNNFTFGGWNDPNAGYKMIIGSYNEETEREYQNWERGLADLCGRWLYSPIDEQEYAYFNCPKGANFRYVTSAELSPRGTPFSIKNVLQMQTGSQEQSVPVPFANFLSRNMMYLNLWNIFKTKRVSFFHRSAANWGTDFERYKNFFSSAATSSQLSVDGNHSAGTKVENQAESLLTDIMPRFQKITGELRLRIESSLGHTSLWKYIREIENQKRGIPMLVIIPESRKIDDVIQVGNISAARNTREEWWKNPNAGGFNPEQQCANNTRCELQSQLEQAACMCPPSTFGSPSGRIQDLQQAQTMPWTEGYGNNFAAAFGVTIKEVKQDIRGGYYPEYRSMPIIFPCGTFPIAGGITATSVVEGGTNNIVYYGNLQKKITNVRYANKTIDIMHEYLSKNTNADGSESIGAGNVSEIRVLNPNLTNNIIQRNESAKNKIVNIYVPGVGFSTLAQYFNFLKNLNDLGSFHESKELTLRFAGTKFGILPNEPIPNFGKALANYIHPRHGLSNLNFSFGEQGMSVDVGWKSRPIEPPKQDIFMTYIGPTPPVGF